MPREDLFIIAPLLTQDMKTNTTSTPGDEDGKVLSIEEGCCCVMNKRCGDPLYHIPCAASFIPEVGFALTGCYTAFQIAKNEGKKRPWQAVYGVLGAVGGMFIPPCTACILAYEIPGTRKPDTNCCCLCMNSLFCFPCTMGDISAAASHRQSR